MEDFKRPEKIRTSGRLDDYKVTSKPDDLHDMNTREPEEVAPEEKIGASVKLRSFKQSKIGRTLTGRNKLGQALGVAAGTVLAFTPLKKLSEITGHINTTHETKMLGISADSANLGDRTIQIIKYSVTAILILLLVTKVLSIADVRDIISLFKLSGIL